MTEPNLSGDGRNVTVRIALSIRKRGGRKLVLAPDGATDTWMPSRRRIDSTIVKAIARAFRWRKLLETGVFATIDEVAAADKINASYVSRVLRLTLLAPAIVDVILDGRQPAHITLASLLRPFPVEWWEQIEALFQNYPTSSDVSVAQGTHSPSSESFSPSSRSATLVSSTFCGETPSSGATSTRSVSFNPGAAANFDSTFV
jgi:hypothetical protein